MYTPPMNSNNCLLILLLVVFVVPFPFQIVSFASTGASLKVLRRSQFGLQEGGTDEGAKDGENPKGKGKGRGKGRGRKGKGRGRGKSNKASQGDDQNKEDDPTEPVVEEPPPVKIPEAPKTPAEVDVAQKEKGGPPKRTRKPKVEKEEPEQSAGSQVKKAKSSKAPKGKNAQSQEEAEKVEVNPKSEPAKKRTTKEVEQKDGGKVEEAKKKRVRHSESQTFARRNQPTTPFGKAKWVALRAAFIAKVKPFLEFYSAHEDCCSKNVIRFLKLYV